MNFIKRLRWIFVSRRPFRMTRAGWVFILYTIGVGAGAINTGNNLLYIVFGFFLGLMLASGVLSDLNVWGFEVSVEVPEEAEAGKPLLIPFFLKNKKKKIPALGLRAEWQGEIQGSPLNCVTALPYIPPHARHGAVSELVPLRRGRLEITALRLATTFPFGLLKKWWTYRPYGGSLLMDDFGFYGETLVGPAILKPEEMNWRRVWQDGASESVTHVRGEGTALHGLRDYIPSDSFRNIHWKASARKAFDEGNSSPWLVKEMEREEEAAFYFLWPEFKRLHEMNDEDFEKLVGFSASFLKFSRGDGHPSHLVVPKPDSGSSVLLYNKESAQHAFFSLVTRKVGGPELLLIDAETWPDAGNLSSLTTVDLLDSFRSWKTGSVRVEGISR